MTYEEAIDFKATVDHKDGYFKVGILQYKVVIVPKERMEFSDYFQDKYKYEDLQDENSQKYCKSGDYTVVGIRFKNSEGLPDIISREKLPLKS